MKQLWKAGAMLAMAAVMVCAGVYAAATASHRTSSTVSFISTNVYVDIAGTSTLGATKEYSGATYTDFSNTGAKEKAEDWTLGDMLLDETTYTATIAFTFTNQGDALTKIVVTAPTLTDSFAVVQTVKIGEAEPVALVDQEIKLAYGETATFTYTITLVKFNKNISAAACNFDVSLTKVESQVA